jgi:putative transposase
MRKNMVEKQHPQLSQRRQCELLVVNRNRLDPTPRQRWEPNALELEIMELMKLIHATDPTMGARQLRVVIKRNGYELSRWKAGRMMRRLGLRAIYCQPRTSIPNVAHPKYPYLLRGREVERPDEVWCTDITYIPWIRGHVYLSCIMDWHTRAVLAWRLSNTMDVSFCLEALTEAVAVAGVSPKIFNTDQGSQFTGVEWLSAVESLGARVSMDGKGRWMDNVLIERLWRSIKHEWIFLHTYETLPELGELIGQWIERYNTWRPHTANDGRTPWEAYRGVAPMLEINAISAISPPDREPREICTISASASIVQISRQAA